VAAAALSTVSGKFDGLRIMSRSPVTAPVLLSVYVRATERAEELMMLLAPLSRNVVFASGPAAYVSTMRPEPPAEMMLASTSVCPPRLSSALVALMSTLFA